MNESYEVTATPDVFDVVENATVPSVTILMIRRDDGRTNHVEPENVQDYLNSGIWAVLQ